MRQIDIGGTARTYAIHVPPTYNPAEPMPLILTLHSDNGTGRVLINLWKQYVPGLKMIVVGPDEPKRHWAIGAAGGGLYEPDYNLAMAAVDEVEKMYNVDLNREYVQGHSRGAFYTFVMAYVRGDRFAAAAMHQGGCIGVIQSVMASPRKAPYYVYNGEADVNVPLMQGTCAVNFLKGAGYEVMHVIDPGIAHAPNAKSWVQAHDFFRVRSL